MKRFIAMVLAAGMLLCCFTAVGAADSGYKWELYKMTGFNNTVNTTSEKMGNSAHGYATVTSDGMVFANGLSHDSAEWTGITEVNGNKVFMVKGYANEIKRPQYEGSKWGTADSETRVEDYAMISGYTAATDEKAETFGNLFDGASTGAKYRVSFDMAAYGLPNGGTASVKFKNIKMDGGESYKWWQKKLAEFNTVSIDKTANIEEAEFKPYSFEFDLSGGGSDYGILMQFSVDDDVKDGTNNLTFLFDNFKIEKQVSAGTTVATMKNFSNKTGKGDWRKNDTQNPTVYLGRYGASWEGVSQNKDYMRIVGGANYSNWGYALAELLPQFTEQNYGEKYRISAKMFVAGSGITTAAVPVNIYTATGYDLEKNGRPTVGPTPAKTDTVNATSAWNAWTGVEGQNMSTVTFDLVISEETANVKGFALEFMPLENSTGDISLWIGDISLTKLDSEAPQYIRETDGGYMLYDTVGTYAGKPIVVAEYNANGELIGAGMSVVNKYAVKKNSAAATVKAFGFESISNLKPIFDEPFTYSVQTAE